MAAMGLPNGLHAGDFPVVGAYLHLGKLVETGLEGGDASHEAAEKSGMGRF
jgi:hypothetical protein